LHTVTSILNNVKDIDNHAIFSSAAFQQHKACHQIMIWVAAINSGTYPYWYFLYNAVRHPNLEKLRNLFSQNFEIK